HASLGIWLALGALAFVLSGLPWTGSWGKQFKSLATSVNLGSPPGAWGGSSLHSTRPGAKAAKAGAAASAAAAPMRHAHG
ncbi:PepSY domain-containing protein, partial [Burkholderia cepacia]